MVSAKNGLFPAARRVAVAATLTLAVAASLVTFPSAVPWLIACWIGLSTWLVIRGQPGWLPLAAIVGILVAKDVGWPASLLLLVMMLAMNVITCWLVRPPAAQPWKRIVRFVPLVLLWTAWAGFAWDWHAAARCSRQSSWDPVRPVVCPGDSLTAFGYPRQLAALITAPVVDHGADGITTVDGLKTLPAIVAANPQVLVIELGGHDFLKGYGRAQVKRNLQQIISTCRQHGTEVVLMEIPRGFIHDPFHGLERELAREHDLQLVADTPIRQLVLWSPFAPPGIWLERQYHLSEDGLHPNHQGNQVLARAVAKALASLYGEQALAQR